MANSAKHPLPAWLLLLAKLFERAGYYGFRSVLTMYLVNHLKWEHDDAYLIYTIMTFSLAILPMSGALIGDLWLGHKRTMLIGILTAMVAFLIMMIPGGFFAGVILMVLGESLFSANFLASLMRVYPRRSSNFIAILSAQQGVINLGAFFWGLLIALLTSPNNFFIALAFCAASFLIAGIFIWFVKQKESESTVSMQAQNESNQTFVSIGPLLTTILLCMLFSGLFWLSYEWLSDGIINMLSGRELSSYLFKIQAIIGLILIPLSFIACLWLSFRKPNPLLLAWLGVLLLFVSCTMLAYGLVFNEGLKISLFIAIHVTATIAEVLFLPALLQLVAWFGSGKFKATHFAFMFIPYQLFNFLVFKLFKNEVKDQDKFGLMDPTDYSISPLFILLLILCIGGLVLFLIFRKRFRYGEEETVYDTDSLLDSF